jgi:hypothetical protein
MDETRTKNKSLSSKKKNSNSGKLPHLKTIKAIRNSLKLILPRDVQNANCIIFSKINLNKYFWEIDGEKVKLIIKKINRL